jgi:hypothetical protein
MEHANYELKKVGQKITHIKFIVHKKENTDQTGEKQKNFYRWKNLITHKYYKLRNFIIYIMLTHNLSHANS